MISTGAKIVRKVRYGMAYLTKQIGPEAECDIFLQLPSEVQQPTLILEK